MIKKQVEVKTNRTIRPVVYHEKEKKHALPNRKCTFGTVQEEMEDRQETVERTLKVYNKMLPNLIQRLGKIKDPRNPRKIKHKIDTLLLYGILMFMYMIGSRREANRELSRAIFFDNLKAMFPELETMPHADTLARLLGKIDVEQIQECMIGLLKDLIRNKKFKNFLHNNRYLIAIDGTQKYTRNYQWAPECLERNVGKEEKTTQYYCYILEAVLILDNGIVLPIMSEFIENDNQGNPKDKQDCELKGFYRMAKKLKEIFGRTKLTLIVDGLYACGPVITICNQYKWDYMITLKKDSIPTIWKEAHALMRINPENQLKCYWGEREQIYSWANEIEYEYIKGNRKKKEILNVVTCDESWEENHTSSTGKTEIKETKYAWLSSRKINETNVFLRCTKIARYRWKLENNILKEKHQGYEYEHCFSYTWDAMKGFHYLMKMGHFVNVLTLNSEILKDKVDELGIRGFIKYLKLSCSGSELDKVGIKAARENTFMWRLALTG